MWTKDQLRKALLFTILLTDMLSCTMLTFKSVGVNKLVHEMGQRVIFAWSLINPQMKFRLIRFQKWWRCAVVTEYIHYIQLH